jgi:hypothetical protein
LPDATQVRWKFFRFAQEIANRTEEDQKLGTVQRVIIQKLPLPIGDRSSLNTLNTAENFNLLDTNQDFETAD